MSEIKTVKRERPEDADPILAAIAPQHPMFNQQEEKKGPWFNHYADSHKKQLVDKIVIETEPRLKDSDLSGREWRFHANVTAYYKGKKVADTFYSDVQSAMGKIKDWYEEDAFFTINPRAAIEEDGKPKCDQEGCCSDATKAFKHLKKYCQDCSKEEVIDPEEEIRFNVYCDAHSDRGDLSLTDSVRNLKEFPLADIPMDRF